MLGTMAHPSFPALSGALADVADPARAQSMAAYLRGQFDFLGVATPSRRAASTAVLRELRDAPDWEFVATCWATEQREFQYVACDHLREAPLDSADLPRLKELVTTKSWWDTVDALVKPIGRAGSADDMLEWAGDDNLWVRRAAILHQLGRKTSTNPDLLSEIILGNLGSGEFFIDKAIGWALRDYSKVAPAWVRGFLVGHAGELAPLSRREAAKYL